VLDADGKHPRVKARLQDRLKGRPFTTTAPSQTAGSARHAVSADTGVEPSWLDGPALFRDAVRAERCGFRQRPRRAPPDCPDVWLGRSYDAAPATPRLVRAAAKDRTTQLGSRGRTGTL